MSVHGPRQQGYERHAQEIGEGDASYEDRMRHLVRIVRKTRRQQMQKLLCKHQRQNQKYDLRNQQQCKNLGGKPLGRTRPFRFKHSRIAWNIGCVERALAEDCAKMVRQTEGDVEGVSQRAGAQDSAEHYVPDEAGDT